MNPEQLYETLRKYTLSLGTELNRDKPYVMELMEGLIENQKRYGYRSCPCRLASGDGEKDKDIVCPCAYKNPDVEEYGSCYCGLYVKREWNEGKIEHVKVPERRPIDKRP